jgi:hypothetical protein
MLLRTPSPEMTLSINDIVKEAKTSGTILEVGPSATRLQAAHPDENIALEDIVAVIISQASNQGIAILIGSPAALPSCALASAANGHFAGHTLN